VEGSQDDVPEKEQEEKKKTETPKKKAKDPEEAKKKKDQTKSAKETEEAKRKPQAKKDTADSCGAPDDASDKEQEEKKKAETKKKKEQEAKAKAAEEAKRSKEQTIQKDDDAGETGAHSAEDTDIDSILAEAATKGDSSEKINYYQKAAGHTDQKFQSMKIKELKQFLLARGEPCAECVEKSQYVKKAFELRDAPVVRDDL